ncbi:PspC domain-containing protein [soil metagenome]
MDVPSFSYRKLYRSRKEKIIAGVCGGLAEHFDLDPTWIRLAFVVCFFLAGSALVIYVVMWLIVPVRPENMNITQIKDPST